MRVIDNLLDAVTGQDAPVRRVLVGLHWTLVESRGVGIAHTWKTSPRAQVADAGTLAGRRALDLAARLRSWEPLDAAVGLAALNSLVEPPPGLAGNAFEHVEALAAGRTVTIVGRFPNTERIARVAGRLHVLEIDPEPGELPAAAAEEVLPRSDLALITATALINKTLPRLLELAAGGTAVVLGPSTPLGDVLFRHGASILAGVRVSDPAALFAAVAEGVKPFRRLAGTEPVVRHRGAPGAAGS